MHLLLTVSYFTADWFWYVHVQYGRAKQESLKLTNPQNEFTAKESIPEF